MQNKKKICVITGTRAEYGLLYWLIKGIQADDELSLQVIAMVALRDYQEDELI